jgi:hypothetical protein
MARAAIAQTHALGRDAGVELGRTLRAELGASPDALIVFATPDQDHAALLAALRESCSPGALVGCSSAGEFTTSEAGVGLTCAIALRGDDMRFTATLARGIHDDHEGAARALAESFHGSPDSGFRHRSALVLTDALAGFASELVDRLTLLTGGLYRFFGGGAGDDGRFQHTVVFCDELIASDAVVALEILSEKPIGIGVRHGWGPSPERMRVTESAGMLVGSLNATPAVEVFDAHAAATGQRFDHEAPLPFFLHNVLGVESAEGYRLRVPLGIQESGSVLCAADVPAGATACIMGTSAAAAADAAAEATRSALAQLGDHEPLVAFLFDCVATRLRLGQEFSAELDAVQRELGSTPFAGFNTYGQIAQVEGQFSGFHNCTAVVCVLPR